MDSHRQAADIPKWSALLVEAVNKPGLIMKAYTAFHSYSLGNQILALVQCQMRGLQPGPINTFPEWQDLGRHVKRGERALTLCVPIRRKRRNETGDDEPEGTFTSFVYKARWFALSQTEGADFCRGYLQNWLYQGVGFDANAIPEKSAQKVLRCADKILRAGRPNIAPEEHET